MDHAPPATREADTGYQRRIISPSRHQLGLASSKDLEQVSSMQSPDLWQGLAPAARACLETRDYHKPSPAQRLGTTGVEARELTPPHSPELNAAWIPGVAIFPRTIHTQPARGFFGEFARENEGPTGAIGMWPRQWAAARMFAGTAKGFHIHPPHIPAGTTPEAWFQRLFITEPENHTLRPYALEQWDLMFFLQGIAEMILTDERAGLPRRIMRFLIWGDDLPSANNVGVIIPAGVAHAIRSASSNDLLMVYGTSTTFVPANEGRLHSSVESAPLPETWQDWLHAPAPR